MVCGAQCYRVWTTVPYLIDDLFQQKFIVLNRYNFDVCCLLDDGLINIVVWVTSFQNKINQKINKNSDKLTFLGEGWKSNIDSTLN